MPHRDQEIAMLRREVELLMGEREVLLGWPVLPRTDCQPREQASAGRCRRAADLRSQRPSTRCPRRPCRMRWGPYMPRSRRRPRSRNDGRA